MATEKELKYKLTKSDYTRLLRAVRPFPSKKVRQDNYYFDDPHFSLRKNKVGLRIRVLDTNKAVLTLKQNIKDQKVKLKGYKVRREYEVSLPLTKAKSVIKKKLPIEKLNGSPIRELKRIAPADVRHNLKPLGKLQTTRKVVSLGNKLYLEIDRFKIFDKTYYEFEVETSTPTEVDNTIRRFLKHYKIAYRPERTSKLKRFLKEWKRRHTA